MKTAHSIAATELTPPAETSVRGTASRVEACQTAHPSSSTRNTASAAPRRRGPGRLSGWLRSHSAASSRGTLSSITTNRKSTMMAPAYTMICVTAVNGESSRMYRPASAPKDPISDITL